MGIPNNRWFIRNNTMKMDDFRGTPISGNLQMKDSMDVFGETLQSYRKPSFLHPRYEVSSSILLQILRRIPINPETIWSKFQKMVGATISYLFLNQFVGDRKKNIAAPCRRPIRTGSAWSAWSAWASRVAGTAELMGSRANCRIPVDQNISEFFQWVFCHGTIKF